jgi:hypothetical protein
VPPVGGDRCPQILSRRTAIAAEQMGNTRVRRGHVPLDLRRVAGLLLHDMDELDTALDQVPHLIGV